MVGSPGCDDRAIVPDDRARWGAVERVYRGEHLATRAPIVLWEIDFDPRQAATLDRPQGAAAAEGPECSRQPFANPPSDDQAVHLFDEHGRAGRTELAY